MSQPALRRAIARLADRHDLDESEAMAVMEAILAGDATPAQMGAILLGLRQKGECVAELVGAARVLRAVGTVLPDAPAGAVDTCGTGGDGSHTFNVSTAAALVVAAAGVPVAKHGNRAVSGSVGSADVLEALGVPLDVPVAAQGTCLREAGIAFLFAPAFQPALRRVADVRRELGIRTLFNLLGPLVNPARVRRQVVGVGDPRFLDPVAGALEALGVERAWVLHGEGGLDELGLEGASEVVEVANRSRRRFQVRASDLGLVPAPRSALRVASVAESAARIRAVLAGEPGPARDIVVLNAAAALVVAGAVADLPAGVARAAQAIDAGDAAGVLQRLARVAGHAAGSEAGA
jgi:anthranilate phosphoribosyltransferase